MNIDHTQRSYDNYEDVGGKVAKKVVNLDASGNLISPATFTVQTDGSQKTQIVDAGGEVATITGGKLDVNATVTVPPVTVDTTGLATDSNQSDGSQKTQIVDSAGDNYDALNPLPVSASIDTTGLALAVNQQTDALTDAELRATPVPVLASIDTTGLATDTTDTNTGTIAGDTTSIDGKIPTLGQALAASSVPVVLTANQITTLTPPAAITGFATSAKQLPDGHTVALSATDNAVLDVIAAKDFATQTTLAALNTKVTAVDTDNVTIIDMPAVSVDTTGLATSAKQLADNHQVTVSNIANTPLVNITTLATSAKQLADGHSVALSATDNAVLDAIDTNTDSGAVVGAGAAATAQRVHLADEDLTALENITVISSGTVTANAGTNLNTSALALETGGNLASIKAKTDNIPALGQALAAASVPVVLTAAQITTLTPPAQGLTDTQLRNTAVPVSLASVPSHAVTFTGSTDVATQTTLAAINTKLVTGTDIGDVTINNSTGAAAVNIQDGGNTITVDGTVAVTNAGITTIAGAVSATHMQVDVLTAPTTAVTGTFYQATQPVSIATMPSTPVTGTFYQATQPVSGTVTANLSATDNTVLDNIDTSTASKYITGIGHGVKNVTTAGTDVALAGSTTCKRVIIQAQTDNTGFIAVGASGVDATEATGTGVLLFAGDSFEMDIGNLINIYIDSTVSGDGVRFTYFT